MVENPFETRSDSFYFVDNKVRIHSPITVMLFLRFLRRNTLPKTFLCFSFSFQLIMHNKADYAYDEPDIAVPWNLPSSSRSLQIFFWFCHSRVRMFFLSTVEDQPGQQSISKRTSVHTLFLSSSHTVPGGKFSELFDHMIEFMQMFSQHVLVPCTFFLSSLLCPPLNCPFVFYFTSVSAFVQGYFFYNWSVVVFTFSLLLLHFSFPSILPLLSPPDNNKKPWMIRSISNQKNTTSRLVTSSCAQYDSMHRKWFF